MNILLLSNHLNTGGITSYLLSLSKGLKNAGHRVYLASSGGNCVTKFTEQGIIFIPIPVRTKAEFNPFALIPSALILRSHCREKGIEIIHANTRVTQVLARCVSAMTGIPFVTTCHGFFKNRISRRLLPCWGSQVIAISESVRGHCIDDLGLADSLVSVVYSGIDFETLRLPCPAGRQELREKYSPGLAGPLVSVVARLSAEKGHEYLIRAMKAASARVPGIRLLIVGEGKTEPALKSLVSELGLDKTVGFVPVVSSIREIYYISDICVLPSVQEGLGLGLMEAMAWGKPVIGSAVGGIKNLIRDGENGLLVRPADPDALAAAIIDLLERPDRAATMGNNARLFIEKQFPLEKMVSGTVEVYARCLKG